MKEIQGYLGIGSTGKLDVLFGPAIDVAGCVFQTFQTNGLLPFPSLQAARAAKEEIRRKFNKDFIDIKTAKITLTIAENSKDVDSFKGRQGFVVIIDRGFDLLLIGEYVEGKWSYNIGGLFQANGQRPIESLDAALWAASEAARQEESSAKVAHIVYEEVSE